MLCLVLSLFEQQACSVRTTHQWSRCYGSEPHRASIDCPRIELLRLYESIDGQIALARFARRQILAQRQHVDVCTSKSTHGIDHLVVRFAEADHNTAFC